MKQAKAIWIAAKASYRLGATLPEAFELASLCVLTVCRVGSPTCKMYLGQARALSRRIQARNARAALAA